MLLPGVPHQGALSHWKGIQYLSMLTAGASPGGLRMVIDRVKAVRAGC